MQQKRGYSFYTQMFRGVMLFFAAVVVFGFAIPADAARGGKPDKGGGNDFSYEGESTNVFTVYVCGEEGVDVICYLYDTDVAGMWVNSYSSLTFPDHMCAMYFPEPDRVERKSDMNNFIIHIMCGLKKKFRLTEIDAHFDDGFSQPGSWQPWCKMHDEPEGAVMEFYHHDLYGQELEHSHEGLEFEELLVVEHADYALDCSASTP